MADLSGFTVEPAGPDVQPTDQDAFLDHATTRPPAGCWSGWQAHPDTLTCLRETEAAAGPRFVRQPLVSLVGMPIYLADEVPVGVLRPVHVRPREA